MTAYGYVRESLLSRSRTVETERLLQGRKHLLKLNSRYYNYFLLFLLKVIQLTESNVPAGNDFVQLIFIRIL